MTTTAHHHWFLRHPPGGRATDGRTAGALLTSLPAQLRQPLMRRARPVSCRRNDELLHEGASGEGIYVIERGTATFSIAPEPGRRDAEPVVVGRLSRGDIVGESSVLDASGRYDCTVRADSTVRAWFIPVDAVREAIAADGGAEAALTALESHLHAARFLRLLSPLGDLDPAALWALAGHLHPRTCPAGARIAATLDAAACLLLADGVAEAAEGDATAGPTEPRRLHAGALFGENALAGGSAGAATVVAISDCTVYEVPREALLEALRTSSAATGALLRLVELDARPRRAPGVDVVVVTDRPGVTAILTGAASGVDFQLSAVGEWLWAHLDGTRTVRQLVLDVFYSAHTLDPTGVARIVARLAESGFVTGLTPPSVLAERLHRPSAGQRLLLRVRRLLEWRLAWTGADAPVTRLYQRLVRPVYNPAGAAVGAALGLVGLAALVVGVGRRHPQPAGGVVATVIVSGYLLALVLHETGHAVTTKAADRRVLAIGVGWYWFGPMAFVDTTDMWSAPRRQRLLVSLAGPLADAVFGGLFAVAALVAGTNVVGACFWDLAVVFYVGVLLNLNPLMEYDGYYVLIDLVERPNLRAEALSWLRSSLGRTGRGRAGVRGHALDLCYGVGSTLYVLAMSAITLVVYRGSVEKWVASAGSRGVADALGWLVAATIAVLCMLGAASEFRRTPSTEL